MQTFNHVFRSVLAVSTLLALACGDSSLEDSAEDGRRDVGIEVSTQALTYAAQCEGDRARRCAEIELSGDRRIRGVGRVTDTQGGVAAKVRATVYLQRNVGGVWYNDGTSGLGVLRDEHTIETTPWKDCVDGPYRVRVVWGWRDSDETGSGEVGVADTVYGPEC